MLKKEVARGPKGRIVIMDSITQLKDDDADAMVVSASHGGTSSGECALAVPVRLVVFNDAGVGKDQAGIAALAVLQQRGVAALTVSHLSARIGDAQDSWQHGVTSHANAAAQAFGIAPGMALAAALARCVGA